MANELRTPSIPPYALTALRVLEDAGHEAWCVGGFVRDAFLGRPCSDVDLATSAHWEQVRDAFVAQGYAAHETGVKHGTVTVVVDGDAIEITTYRFDGEYADGRHPDQVRFVSSIEEDLARRDFTINAMAYHPDRGLCDPYGGINDLDAHIIKAVGEPMKRFREDALRILRACRFGSQLGFQIEAETLYAMRAMKSMLQHVSAERVSKELTLYLCGAHIHDALMETVDVVSYVLPEIIAMRDFSQDTPYHIYDVLEHTAWVIQNTPPEPRVRWAALLHDSGKPASFFHDDMGVGHFYGHASASIILGESILNRMCFSSAAKSEILTLVKHHDDPLEATVKHVRRFMLKLNGNADLFRDLCYLKMGDALGQAPHCHYRAKIAEDAIAVLDRLIEEEAALSVADLRINGQDRKSVV